MTFVSTHPPTQAPPAPARLRVAAANDAQEREADRVADAVVAGGAATWSFASIGIQGVQRKCASCEDDQRELQRKADVETGPRDAGEAPPIVDDVLRSSGQPLEPGVRSSMERRFGHDFANVRVHDDARAARSAVAVHALAYTVGSDIAFGAGRFAPATREGEHLLAHELAHVVQQTRGAAVPGAIYRKPAAKKTFRPGDYVRVTAKLLGLPNVPYGQPGYKLITRVAANTLLQVIRLLPGTDQIAGTDGVYEFTVMDDYGKPRLDAGGVTMAGVADSAFVSADAGPAPASPTVAPEVKPPVKSDPKADAESEPPVTEVAKPSCSPPAGCPDEFCTPYPLDEAIRRRDAELAGMLSTISQIDGRCTGLYRDYLMGGSDRQDISATFAGDFTRDDVTVRVTEFLVTSLEHDLKANPPAIPAGKGSVEVDVPSRIPKAVKEVGDPLSANSLSYTFALEAPGLLAGGIGANEAACPVGAKPSKYNDERLVTGTAEVFANGDGTFAVNPSLDYVVNDTIDFCPGNCGGLLAQTLGGTVEMSRLEASNVAGDVPFTVAFPSPSMVGAHDDSE
jgi:hypothetical protein